MEESGIPLPVPGDVYVAYLGRPYAASFPHLVLAWLGIIAVGLWAGATFGQSIAGLLSGGRHRYLVVLWLAAVALAVVLVRAWRGRPRRRSGYAGRP